MKQNPMKTCYIGIRVTTETREEILRIANKKGLSITQVVQKAIEQMMKRNK